MSKIEILSDDEGKPSESDDIEMKYDRVELEVLSMEPNEKFCRVCAAPSASLHYGALTCGGCKIFFLRAVISSSAFLCEKTNNCRNLTRCRFCRFQRCIAAGMKPAMVGKKEGAMKRPTRVTDLPLALVGTSAVPQLHCHLIPSGSETFVEMMKRKENSKGDVRVLVELERFCDNNHGKDFPDNDFHYDIDVPLKEGFQEPWRICERTPMKYDSGRKRSLSLDSSDQLRSSYCRSSLHFLDWSRGTPEVWDLAERDRIFQLCSTSTSIVLFSAAYNSYRYGVDGLAFGHQMRLPKNGHDPAMSDCRYRSFNIMLVDYVQRFLMSVFEETRITVEEFVLLKKILFFTSPPCLSDLGNSIVRQAKRKYECMLVKHLSDKYKEENEYFLMKRLSQLMGLIPHCMKIGHLGDTLFAKMVIYNVKNIRGRLSIDMHVKSI
ncbi:unnamed protein product, partial [Mesorhabditis belari]|uniref:Uncharacterized protein n=1 Tax=Mesorhabditis belari TaxID=2138241 RepID=A0AAF3EQ58_9BILA